MKHNGKHVVFMHIMPPFTLLFMSFLLNPGDQGEIGEEGDQGKMGKYGPPGLPGIQHPSIYYILYSIWWGERRLSGYLFSHSNGDKSNTR